MWEMEEWYLAARSVSISVIESSVEDFDSNLAGLRHCHSNVNEDQGFVEFPGQRNFIVAFWYKTTLSLVCFLW
ncbi:ankyrin and armadillo repeat-containing [Sesbania bispinosa]|nr:ankyrin and armadillo repeat-containing [Sesbania bispinosa]